MRSSAEAVSALHKFWGLPLYVRDQGAVSISRKPCLLPCWRLEVVLLSPLSTGSSATVRHHLPGKAWATGIWMGTGKITCPCVPPGREQTKLF